MVQVRSTPLIEPIEDDPGFSFVTFLWHGSRSTTNVVLFDGVADFDAKSRLQLLAGTNVWYLTFRIRNDARFAYNLSPDDSLVSFYDIKEESAKEARLAMLKTDPLNPHHCPTTFANYGAEASYVELPSARPLLWEESVQPSTRGQVRQAKVISGEPTNMQSFWTYTPAGFDEVRERLPLLIVFDGKRNLSWIPKLLDLLIAQRLIQPTVAVLTDQSMPGMRDTELGCSETYASFLALELVPWARENLHATLDREQTVVAGSSLGGLQALFTAVRHPEIFGNAITLSGSFWWKPTGSEGREWLTGEIMRLPLLPIHVHQEVGLMEPFEAQVETNRHMRDALTAKHYAVSYAEYDGGHSFLNWSGGMVAGLKEMLADGPIHTSDK